jgi:phosphoglycolate phosphatase
MGYQLAIFDFDGTLADSFGWFCRAVTDAAQRYRFQLASQEELEQLRQLDARQIARRLGVAPWKVPFIARYMRRHMAQELEGIRLFPGIEETLRGLGDSGLTLAIVTSNAQQNVRRVLGPELCKLIAHYGCGASIFGKRPKLRAVLRAHKVPPERSIYLGDELRDLHAARAERIPFGAVSWGYTLPHAFTEHRPQHMFTSPREIIEGLVSVREFRVRNLGKAPTP